MRNSAKYAVPMRGFQDRAIYLCHRNLP